MFWEPNLLTALQKLTALRGRRLEMAVQLEFLSLQIRLTLLVLMLKNLTAAWAVYLSSGSQLFKPSDCTVVSHLKDATLRKEPSGRTREETARQLSLATWSCSAVPTLHQDSTCCLAGFLPCCVEQKPNFQVFMVITAIKTKTLLTALHATISCLLWINTICSLVYCKLAMICSHQSQLWSLKYQAVTRLFGAVVSMINKNMWTCHSILV